MADYIVSARKYRPDSFEALIGQDNIARTLKNSVQRGQLAHAYLFCGPRGVGKTSTARIFAKTINCSHPGKDLEPCGECESCLAFKEGRSYNIHELDAASNNSVDDIRTLLEQVQIPPQVGSYSVYIIDEVHMLSAQAFNAFLKTLEEPPAHAVFILCTTEKHKILPTILSRCQTYDFNRITIPDICSNLRAIAAKEEIQIDDESLHVIARKADGAMRDALTIFDQSVAFCGTDIHYADVIRNLGVLDFDYHFRLVDAFLSADYATALLLFDEILSKGFNALHFIGDLSGHLRDLLVARTGGLDALLDQPDSVKARYRDQASRCSVKFLYDALGITSECEAGYKASSNQRLHIEYALMKLAFLAKAPAQDAAPAPQQVQAPAASSAAAPAASAAGRPNPQAGLSPSPMPAEGLQPAAAPAPADSVAQASAEEPVELLLDDAIPAAVPESAAASDADLQKQPKTQEAQASEPGVQAKSAENASRPASEQPAPAQAAGRPDPQAGLSPSSQPAEGLPPAAAPAPAPAGPTPRRRGAATAKLASLMEDSKPEAAEDKPAEAATHIPADEEILDGWKDLVSKVSQGRPRLENTLAGAKLSVSAEGEFKLLTFEVVNEAQRGWIMEKILRDLEKEYNAMLGTSMLHLAVSVRPAETIEPKIYMPEEKAQDLMEKNPEVRKLVKDFGLDTK